MLIYAEGPVMCDSDRNNSGQKHTARCHVNHSSNTVPVFSCPSPSASASASTAEVTEVRSDVRQVRVSECAYEKVLYNMTTFSVHTADNVTPFTCTARFTAVQDPSVVYYEEPFVVFYGLNETQPTDSTGQCDFS